ncbi:hypothetical protein Peur_009530 [Populus x canadensis]
MIVWVAGLPSKNLHECSSQHPRLLTCHPRLCSSKMKNKVVYGFCTDHRPKPGSQYVSFIIVFIKIILPSCVKGSYNWSQGKILWEWFLLSIIISLSFQIPKRVHSHRFKEVSAYE